MTLTDFLLARIAEDEEAARKAIVPLAFEPFRKWVLTAGSPNDMPGAVLAEPARVMAECEAKRRIVEAHQRQVEDDDPHVWIVASNVLLRALALPYADHPDYREGWKP